MLNRVYWKLTLLMSNTLIGSMRSSVEAPLLRADHDLLKYNSEYSPIGGSHAGLLFQIRAWALASHRLWSGERQSEG